MYKKILTLAIGLFLTVSFTLAQGTIDDYKFTLAQGIADYGFTLAQGEANAFETTEPVARINYREGEVYFQKFEKVELNIIIQEGDAINTTANGRVEILLKGRGVVRLDRNTRVVFATLTDQMIVLEAWSGNIYVEKGDLEIGIKSSSRSLNLSQSEWYLNKPEKNFKKWNSKREKELISEPEYDYDYRGYDGYGYGRYYSPYYGYGFGLYNRYYPYYGYYGYYYPYYGYGFGLFGGYYPYYYGYGYRNYNFYGYSSRGYGYDSYGRGKTVIRKDQLKRKIPGNVSSSHFKTSFSATTSKSASVSKLTDQISPKNNILKHGQSLENKQRTRITTHERKKIQTYPSRTSSIPKFTGDPATRKVYSPKNILKYNKYNQSLENKQRTRITTHERKKIQTYPSRTFSIPKFTGDPATRKTYSPDSSSVYRKPYFKSPKKYVGSRPSSKPSSRIFSKSSKSYPKSGPSFSSSTRSFSSHSRPSQGKRVTSGKVVKKNNPTR